MTKRMNLSDALHRGAAQAVKDAGAFSTGPKTPDPGTPPGKVRAMKPQGLATDQFFYFFLRLRKNEVKRCVQRAHRL